MDCVVDEIRADQQGHQPQRLQVHAKRPEQIGRNTLPFAQGLDIRRGKNRPQSRAHRVKVLRRAKNVDAAQTTGQGQQERKIRVHMAGRGQAAVHFFKQADNWKRMPSRVEHKVDVVADFAQGRTDRHQQAFEGPRIGPAPRAPGRSGHDGLSEFRFVFFFR